jgi:NagD protein
LEKNLLCAIGLAHAGRAILERSRHDAFALNGIPRAGYYLDRTQGTPRLAPWGVSFYHAAMNRLASIKHLALDLDGTLYLGRKLFPFTLDFLQQLKELGIGRTFFTNNSSLSTADYVRKLRALGIDAGSDAVFSSTTATIAYVRRHMPAVARLLVLGTPALREEFSENGFEAVRDGGARDPDAVIVGFDTTLDYPRLCQAAYWIARGKPFLATNCDAVCPTDQATVLPDCGSICKLLTHATGREPDAVLGKPSSAMLAGMMERCGVTADRIAVVGDRLYTDIAMARAAGALGVLVLSGETTRARAESAQPRADLIVENVAELGDLLAAARKATDE